ncbi:TonB-dependent receptor [Aquirufa sp. 5-AUSEE-100C1]
MKKIIQLSLVCLAACLPLGAFAQSIQGKITSQDGSLPGATVRVKGTNLASISNEFGDFRLALPKSSSVNLQFSFIGYQNLDTTITLTTSLNSIGEIRLKPAANTLGEVIVKGFVAGSQSKAYSIKKNSMAIMDVLVADAIGKLPDRNAAEAIQRIQGVAVARYHGEADQATVRGTPFSWTSTLFNGSRLPSASVYGTRASILDAVPSEMIQRVEVSKAITPDMEADAIGGSINFVTKTSPLKRVLNVSAAGGYNSFSQDGSSNGSVTFGDRFFGGKLGLVVTGAFWDRNWGADSYDVSYNTGAAIAMERTSINSIMFKRYMGKRQTYGLTYGIEYKFNNNHKIFSRGLWDKFNDIRPVHESYVDYTNRRYQYNYRYSHYQTALNGFELGGEHYFGDKLKVDWLASSYQTKFFLETPSTSGTKGLPIATFRQRINGGFIGLSSNGKKYWNFDSPDGIGQDPLLFDPMLGDANEKMDATKLTLQQMVIYGLDTEEADKNLQINFTHETNSRLKLKSGLKFRTKTRDASFGTTAVWVPNAALGIPNSPALLTLSSLPREEFPIGAGYFNPLTLDYSSLIMNPLTPQGLFDLFSPAALTANGMRDVSPATNATLKYQANESVVSAYAMAEYKPSDALTLIGGLRSETTLLNLDGNKLSTTRVGTTTTTGITPIKQENNYTNLLPMLHAKLALNEKSTLRFAYTSTFSRANFSELNPGENVDLTQAIPTITRGNTGLKPTRANNFDIMYENYFDNLGLVSGGVFYKQLKDIIFSNRSMENIGGTSYLLTQASNISNGSLLGFEMGINKRFTFLPGILGGLGVEANYTYIQSEASVPVIGTTRVDKTSLPNQSKHLYNLILFYERNGLMLRLAGNYRGASLETINQALGKEFYTYTGKNFTVDASASVQVSKKIKAFIELNNLTNEPLKTYLGDERRVTMSEWYSSRGQAGIRWDLF